MPCSDEIGMYILNSTNFLYRKEVIHPQLRLGIPCSCILPIFIGTWTISSSANNDVFPDDPNRLF